MDLDEEFDAEFDEFYEELMCGRNFDGLRVYCFTSVINL
jgi:hypothetical protein